MTSTRTGRRSGIIGTGSALPARCVSNEELSKFLETTDEWIRTRVGVGQRHIAGPNESAVTLAADASRRAIEAAGIQPADIDVVIVATVTADQPLPSAAALLQSELGIPPVMGFDIRAACSGFIFALATAQSLLESTGGKHALVVGSETISRIVDWKDRATSVLFGDGAGAVILRHEKGEESPIVSTSLHTDGQQKDLIRRKSGAFPPETFPDHEGRVVEGSPYVEMAGREVFRFGVLAMCSSMESVLEKSGTKISDVKLVIPHQSNQRMVDSVCDRLNIDQESQVMVNLERVGNTSAASIPIALDEATRQGRLAEGDLLLLTAVGSGMTYGAVLFRW